MTGGFTDVFKTGAVEFVNDFIQDAMPWPVYLLAGLVVIALVDAILYSLGAGAFVLALGLVIWPAMSLLYTSLVDMGDAFQWSMIPMALLFSVLLLPVTVFLTFFILLVMALACLSLSFVMSGIGGISRYNAKESADQKQVIVSHDAGKEVRPLATAILAGVGGKKNIEQLAVCATRLRFTLKNGTLINGKAMKAAGAYGVIQPSKTECQVVIGTKAKAVCEELRRLM